MRRNGPFDQIRDFRAVYPPVVGLLYLLDDRPETVHTFLFIVTLYGSVCPWSVGPAQNGNKELSPLPVIPIQVLGPSSSLSVQHPSMLVKLREQ